VVNSPALRWSLTFYATSLPTQTSTLWMLEAQLFHQQLHDDVAVVVAGDAAILNAPHTAADDVY